jgi:hypothetical protein
MPSSTNELSSTEKASISATTKSDVHCPTIIPTSSSSSSPKTIDNLLTKARITSSSISTRPQQPIPELPLSTVTTVTKRNVISTRSTSNISQNPIISNSRSSQSNSQTSASSISTISSTTRNNAIRSGGIQRLTKNTHQIIKSTGATKRTNQVNQYFLAFYVK